MNYVQLFKGIWKLVLEFKLKIVYVLEKEKMGFFSKKRIL